LLLSKYLHFEVSSLCVECALYYIHKISVLFNYVTDCLIKKNIYIYVYIVVFVIIVNYIMDYRSYPYGVLSVYYTRWDLFSFGKQNSISPHSTGSKKISIILKYDLKAYLKIPKIRFWITAILTKRSVNM